MLLSFLRGSFVLILAQQQTHISRSIVDSLIHLKFPLQYSSLVTEERFMMDDPTPMSKRKLKKLKRDQEWEENREERKAKRKQKIKEKKERRRAALGAGAPVGVVLPNPSDNATQSNAAFKLRGKRQHHSIQLPITIILDCAFDDLMSEKECKSLGAQITRCYSDNQKAPFKAHLVISSFQGRLKERFDKVLSGQYSSWKGVRFYEDDFCEVGEQAKEWMKGDHGGEISGALAKKESPEESSAMKDIEAGELVYLTSDSPDTLTELKPYSTYVIGGLVDRNRHKGICYKRAMERGVKTAKLPIGDYMQMTSRFVLATNHVAEIMLRWLELGNWGEAFLRVIPKRKGGFLKSGVVESADEMGTQTENQDNDDEVEPEDDGEERENLKGENLEQAEPEAGIEQPKEHEDRESPIPFNKIQ